MRGFAYFGFGGILAAAMFASAHAGSLSFNTVFRFPGGPPDNFWATPLGATPIARMISRNGVLYGTMQYGGVVNANCGQGCGTVFQYNLHTGAFSTIYSFAGATDGSNPRGGVVADSSGALYGTTWANGADGAPDSCCGTVFKLSPPAQGQTDWTFTTLHIFAETPGDGADPGADLIIDSSGLLYGTTINGGSGGCVIGARYGCGTVFRLDPATGETTTLYSFQAGADGAYPVAPVTFGKDGLLYGTTAQGGGGEYNCEPNVAECGTVFALDPTSGTFSTILTFTQAVAQNTVIFPFGRDPQAGLTVDAKGALYGTTKFGGGCCGAGTIFKLAPNGPGHWAPSVPYIFICNEFSCPAGGVPVAPLVMDDRGMLYGAASSNCCGGGAVFQFNPGTDSATFRIHAAGGPYARAGHSPVTGRNDGIWRRICRQWLFEL